MRKSGSLIIRTGIALGVLIVILIAVAYRLHTKTNPEFSGIIWLPQGQRLETKVDLSVFFGFRPDISLTEATQEFGPPNETRFDELFQETLYLWTNAHGMTGLILVPGSYPPPTWQLWGYPVNRLPNAVIRDSNLLSQVMTRLHPKKKTWVHVGDVDGQVRFLMDERSIEFLTLSGKPRPNTGVSNQASEVTDRKLAEPHR